MRFKKLIPEEQTRLEDTDLKLIRMIEDIVEELQKAGMLKNIPAEVDKLLKHRKELRGKLGGGKHGKV